MEKTMMNKTDWFKTINSEEKAYWLGFLCADGCVLKNEKQVTFNLSEKDGNHLQKLADIFERNTVQYFVDDKRTEKRYYHRRLALNSIHMVKDLLSKGIYPKKSLVLTDEVFNHIPQEYLKDFIRGYFDGDGCISFVPKSYETRISICGTDSFLRRMNSILETECGIRISRIIQQDKIHKLEFGNIPNVIKFREWMYTNATVFLERKREKFDSVKQRGTSKYKGISWCNTRKKWIARFMWQRKDYKVGAFDSPEDAVEAYNKKVLEITGDPRKVN
jgi:hypothetical protein